MIGYAIKLMTDNGYCVFNDCLYIIPDTGKIINFTNNVLINTSIKNVQKRYAVHETNAVLTLSFLRKDIIAQSKKEATVLKAKILDCKVI